MSNLICAAASWFGAELDRCQPTNNKAGETKPKPQTASGAEDPAGRSFLEALLFGTSTAGGAVGCGGDPPFIEGEGDKHNEKIDEGESVWACDLNGEEIMFEDPELLNAIREALGRGPGEDITLQDFREMTSLDLRSRGIANLSGIECFENLTELFLSLNQISDVGPLARLRNLTMLWLNANPLSDLEPLTNLVNLRELFLGLCQISDLEPLTNLVNLTRLNLQNNSISDISPLINNPGLAEGDIVYLEGNDSIPSKQIEALRAHGVEVCANDGCQ